MCVFGSRFRVISTSWLRGDRAEARPPPLSGPPLGEPIKRATARIFDSFYVATDCGYHSLFPSNSHINCSYAPNALRQLASGGHEAFPQSGA